MHVRPSSRAPPSAHVASQCGITAEHGGANYAANYAARDANRAYAAGFHVEARRLYGLAADQANATAQVSLAIMHAKGEGGAKDEVEARRLGVPPAMVLDDALAGALRRRDVATALSVIADTKNLDVNAVNPDSGRSALHLAVESAELFAVVEALISRGANVNTPNMNGNTPLHRAAARGNADIALALAEAGADVQAKNRQGQSGAGLG